MDELRLTIRSALAVETVDPSERFPTPTRELVLALGHRVVPILLEIIDDAILQPEPHNGPQRYVAGNAATLLADLGAEAAIEPLLTLLAVVHTDDLECTSDVIWALGRFGHNAVEPTMARYLAAESRDSQELFAGVLACSKVPDERIFPTLLRTFEWDDELAASLLLEYEDPRAIPYFLAMLEAPIRPEVSDVVEAAVTLWDLQLSEAQAQRLRGRPS